MSREGAKPPLQAALDRELLKRNLRLLAERHPRLSGSLARLLEQNNDPGAGVLVESSRTGHPTLALAGEAPRYLHSRYDPIGEAERWAEAHGRHGSTLVVFGFGAGYHAEALLRLGVAQIVTIEPDLRILAATLGTRSLEALFSDVRFQLVVGSDPEQISAMLHPLIVGTEPGKLIFVSLPFYQREYGELWSALSDRVMALTRSMVVDVATRRRWVHQWILNVIKNFPIFLDAPDISRLFGKFKDTPVIIAASGPSLTESLPLLRKVQNRALILAAGSSFNGLLRGGVKPHMIVSYDGGEPNWEHFRGVSLPGIPLAFGSVIYPRIIRDYDGPLWSLHVPSEPLTDYLLGRVGAERTPLRGGPSVANTVLDLARLLGGDPIIFVGQDLAFPGHRLHAEGVRGQAVIAEEEREDYIYVEDNQGGQVPTLPAFFAMLDWFQRYIAGWEDAPRLINTSRQGAKIAGTEWEPLEVVLERFCRVEFDVEARITAVWQEAREQSDQALAPDVMGDLRAEAEELRNLLESIRRKAGQLEDVSSTGRPGRVASLERQLTGMTDACEQTSLFRDVVGPIIRFKDEAHRIREEIEAASATSPHQLARVKARRAKRLAEDALGVVEFMLEVLERELAER